MTELVVNVVYNKLGHIVGVNFDDVTGLAHSGEYDESLAHYGVPGMRWGKRKSGGSSSRPAKKKFSEMTRDEKTAWGQKNGNRMRLAVVGGAVALHYGPKVINLAMDALGSAALATAAARGAKMAAPVIKAISDQPLSAMAAGADGVWRFAP